MTTDLLQEAVALLRKLGKPESFVQLTRDLGSIEPLLAKIDAMPAGEKVPDEVLIWDVENCEEGPFTSEHDYLIAMTELSGEEDLIGMAFRCTMAAQLPSKELTITAVCPVTGNPTEWTETLLAASQRHGGE